MRYSWRIPLEAIVHVSPLDGTNLSKTPSWGLSSLVVGGSNIGRCVLVTGTFPLRDCPKVYLGD